MATASTPAPALSGEVLPPPCVAAPAHWRSCGPKANRAVAASSSQGTILLKAASEVISSSAAPAEPPISDSPMTARSDRPGGACMSSRKPQAPAA